eukprot:COSAG02_NODE_2944_length_7689_cov_9.378920_8_plen_148_part_00
MSCALRVEKHSTFVSFTIILSLLRHRWWSTCFLRWWSSCFLRWWSTCLLRRWSTCLFRRRPAACLLRRRPAACLLRRRPTACFLRWRTAACFLRWRSTLLRWRSTLARSTLHWLLPKHKFSLSKSTTKLRLIETHELSITVQPCPPN